MASYFLLMHKLFPHLSSLHLGQMYSYKTCITNQYNYCNRLENRGACNDSNRILNLVSALFIVTKFPTALTTSICAYVTLNGKSMEILGILRSTLYTPYSMVCMSSISAEMTLQVTIRPPCKMNCQAMSRKHRIISQTYSML